MATFVQTFTVTPKYATTFPIDMLRYDTCYPHSMEDVNRISSAMRRVPNIGEESVTLRRIVDTKTRKPTNDRWLSFGWEVIKVETR